MNTQQLEYVIAISEEKSLSKAADRLLVTQPALSQQIKKLEQELGTKLFRREKNELLLTDAGKVYVNGARSVMSIYQKALEEIEKLKKEGRRQITMVYNNALLPDFTSSILPGFQKICPDILLSTVNGNASVAKDYLMSGAADLAVMASRELSHSLLDFLPLRKEELVMAMAADHPLAGSFEEGGIDFSSLHDQPFILNQSNSFFRTIEHQIFLDRGIVPKVFCEISDLNASLKMVEDHKGFAFIPRSMEWNKDKVKCFPVDPPTAFFVVIAYHKGSVLSRQIKDLIRVMLEIYDGGL